MRKEIRLRRLKAVLAKLKNDEHVQNRSLKALLGKEGYESYLNEWKEQQALREALQNKPEPIVKYEALLQKALLAYGKADGYRGKPAIAERMFWRADEEFERLVEYLQEILTVDPSLQFWFDRKVSWELGQEPGLSPTTVPRVVTSKSLDREGEGFAGAISSKKQTKIAAVERAIEQLENNHDPELQQQILKQKLAELKKSLRS